MATQEIKKNKEITSRESLVNDILKDINNDLNIKIEKLRLNTTLIYGDIDKKKHLVKEKKILNDHFKNAIELRSLNKKVKRIIGKYILDEKYEDIKLKIEIINIFIDEYLTKGHKEELDYYNDNNDFSFFCIRVVAIDRFMERIVLLDFNYYLDSEISKMDEKSINLDKFKNPNLQWYGIKTELIELTKALIENGNLKGKQDDIFKAVEQAFNIELKNTDQAITKFNSRENDTKFLDTLKTSLSQYITNKIN